MGGVSFNLLANKVRKSCYQLNRAREPAVALKIILSHWIAMIR